MSKDKKEYVYDEVMTRYFSSSILQKAEEAKVKHLNGDKPSAWISLDFVELNFLIHVLEKKLNSEDS